MLFPRYDVFISYSRQDTVVVQPFVEELRRRGYTVFFDTQSIVVGDLWKQRLANAVRSSRVCILCWSQHARDSEFVAFEYSRAEGLRRPVLPWLLDSSPLPSMVELQGILETDPAKAASLFVPHLGTKLTLRRTLQVCLLFLLLLISALAYWHTHRPPPPWEFTGRVTDSVTNLPIPGVQVAAEDQHFTTYTDSDGRYVLHLPQPKPKYLHLVFAKQGYKGEEPVTIPPDLPFNTDMTPLK
jgi:TIR domain/CarboxypepD_reg-like domain